MCALQCKSMPARRPWRARSLATTTSTSTRSTKSSVASCLDRRRHQLAAIASLTAPPSSQREAPVPGLSRTLVALFVLCAFCGACLTTHPTQRLPPAGRSRESQKERELTSVPSSDAIHTRVYIMAWLLSVQQRWRCVRAVCVSLSRVWPSAHQLLPSYTSVTSSVRLPCSAVRRAASPDRAA